MGRFDEEIHRRAADSAAAHSRAESEKMDRAAKMAEIVKVKWAEIDELCRAGVRQLTAAGVSQVEVGESYKSKDLWIIGDIKYRYRPTGVAWPLPDGGQHFFLTTEAVLMRGALGKKGSVPRTRGGYIDHRRTLVVDKNIVQPLNEYGLVDPNGHLYGANLPLEEWELGAKMSYGEAAPYLLKEQLLSGISQALSKH